MSDDDTETYLVQMVPHAPEAPTEDVTATGSVTDTVVQRHAAHIIDAAKASLLTHKPGTPWTVADLNQLKVDIDALQGKKVSVNITERQFVLLRLLGFISPDGEPLVGWELIHRAMDLYALRPEKDVMALNSYIRRPHATAKGFNALDVAHAYGLPTGDGTGVTIGIIELSGAYNPSDMDAQWTKAKPNVTVINVAGGKPKSDGPNGADGEVALDVQVVAQIALGAAIRVYFCPNTDTGFLAGIVQATDECDIISISWGGPESSWSAASVKKFTAAFAAARAKGVTVFAAAGDAGSKDGTKADAVDFPASDPNVIGCGGTRLVLNSDGSRKSEVVWDDNPTNDATGGGVSKLFPGRTVPDVAGNADPVTGYTVVVDGQVGVIGGTSAVAPLYAAMTAVVRARHGKAWDFLKVADANQGMFWDVSQGNNGSYSATIGKDDVSGYGTLDFGKLDALLGAPVPVPPSQPPVQPPTSPPPVITPASKDRAFLENLAAQLNTYLKTAS